MPLSVGERAPDFEGTDDEGNKVRLSQLLEKGNVILYFYPKDETPGCTAEACTFRDNWEDFSKLDAQIVGVSSDNQDSHRRFKEKHGLQFRLISDTDKKIRDLYDVRGRIMPPRTTFVISRDGIIRNVFNSQLNFRGHVEESRTVLERLASE